MHRDWRLLDWLLEQTVRDPDFAEWKVRAAVAALRVKHQMIRPHVVLAALDQPGGPPTDLFWRMLDDYESGAKVGSVDEGKLSDA